MISWASSRLSSIVLVLFACTPPPEEVTTTTAEGSSSTTAGPTTMPMTTMPGDGTTAGTQGGTGNDTMVVDDTGPSTSVGETTTADPTTAGSSGPPPECMNPDQCQTNETCDAGGMCVPACNPWIAGNYGSCLDVLGAMNPAAVCGVGYDCLNDDHPYEVTACSIQACVTACDCPAPVAGSDATVTCADVTADMINDCYLSCANGETCPGDMTCVTDNLGNPFLCMTPVPATVPMYGNCDDLVGVTCDGGTCGLFGNASVCTMNCGGPGDCAPAPAGAMAPQCADVFNPPGGNDCFLPCTSGAECPTGMACSDVTGPGGACTW